MKRHRLIIVTSILSVATYVFLTGRSPELPESADRAIILLTEPYVRTKIVEMELADKELIKSMLHAFRHAKSRMEHKCASIGTISFDSGGRLTTLKVLPGHDTEYYEFRYDGNLYRMDREDYIKALLDAGIKREDIRLDCHPDKTPGKGQDAP